MGAPIFFRIEDLNARAKLCEIGFKPAFIKIPMEPLQREKLCDKNGTNNSTKGLHRGI